MKSTAGYSTEDLSAFHAAFVADETFISIIPSFDATEALPLIATAEPVGPFQAGLPATVPLWMALLLQKRSLCTIVPPEWLNATNLSEIIAYERQHADSLFADPERLPHHYYELAMRLTRLRGITFDQGGNGGRQAATMGQGQAQVIQLLVQDLFEVRIDKLRQQFSAIVAQEELEKFTLSITGIAAQELALFRTFIQEALNHRAFLMQPPVIQRPSATASAGTNSHNDNARNYRSSQPILTGVTASNRTGTGDQSSHGNAEQMDNTEADDGNNPESSSTLPRVSIRRFR